MAGLSERIQYARLARSLGIDDVARNAGMRIEDLLRVEEGKSDLSLDVLASLAEALGVSIAFLVEEVEQPKVDLSHAPGDAVFSPFI